MGRTLPEILMARDTLIFLLQHLGFVINLKKSVLHPVKQIEFLGLVIDTEKMGFALSEKKLKYVSQQCQEIFKQPKTSVLNLTELTGLLSSTVQAILPARIQFRYLQQEQILALQKKGSCSGHVTLGNLAREELLWWMENFAIREKFSNKKPIGSFRQMPQQKAGGAYCKGVSTGGKWSKEERRFHINVLGLLALKFAILIFTKNLSHLTIHVQVDNKVAPTYLLKMGTNPQSTASKYQQVNLELSAISSDGNYCRVPSKQIECQSRLGVQECNKLIRLETLSESLSENNQTLRNPNSRSMFVCLKESTCETRKNVFYFTSLISLLFLFVPEIIKF